MISTILSAINLLSVGTRLGILAGLVLALITAYGVWHHRVYAAGYQSALADVARADAKAVARAQSYRAALRECQASGRGWDQTTGRCQ